MNRIKDFFYNKNDIVVAILILAIALAIIYFRVAAIMEYPKTLIDNQPKALIEEEIDNKDK
ncbi:MAG: hypothetical protein RR495_04505 [Anaerovoracaceae bacterium]